MVENTANITKVEEAVTIAPYFTIQIPPIIEVMSGLVFSFMMGLTIAYGELHKLKGIFDEFKNVIVMAIHHVIIPLLPLYIFGIFLQMTYTGQAYHIMLVFIQIIIVIFALHILVLLYQFCIAGGIVRKNPLRLLWNMIPAYLTALGTSSSAATIPVTLHGETIPFHFDTGAGMTFVSEKFVREKGLPLIGDTVVYTGKSKGLRTVIDSLQIGEITVRNIVAGVGLEEESELFDLVGIGPILGRDVIAAIGETQICMDDSI